MVAFSDYSRYDGLGLAELLRQGQVSGIELLEAALARIEAHNPQLNAVVQPLYDQARTQLTAPSAAASSPLAGVPYLLKDLLSAYAGVPLTQGSRFSHRFVPGEDSEVVQRIRRAGLIVLGKTNTPEMGLSQVTEGQLFGPARNPWDLSRTPGGSSGGSGAAVAIGMVPLAGGGDGGGSLRIPAACCGVVGLKPSRGRVPTGPLFGELWAGFVTEGGLSRSVRDSAALLDCLAGPDLGAPYHAPPPQGRFIDALNTPPAALRIAYSVTAPLGFPVAQECQQAVTETAALCESLGHHVEEATPALDMDSLYRDYVSVVAANCAADIATMVRILGHEPRRHELERRTRLLRQLGQAIPATHYCQALQRLQRCTRQLAAFHQHYDLWLSPVTALLPPTIGALDAEGVDAVAEELLAGLKLGGLLRHGTLLERFIRLGFRFTPHPALQNISGQPAISLPLHWTTAGLPIGVQFVARYGEEELLLSLAATLEAASPWRDRHPPGWF